MLGFLETACVVELGMSCESSGNAGNLHAETMSAIFNAQNLK